MSQDHTHGHGHSQDHTHDHGHSQDHSHGHSHGHGNEKDQGLKAMVRYLKIAPRMWRSVVNDATVDFIKPQSGETVVDIGAGMGPGVMRAAASGAKVVAVEPTPVSYTHLTLPTICSV